MNLFNSEEEKKNIFGNIGKLVGETATKAASQVGQNVSGKSTISAQPRETRQSTYTPSSPKTATATEKDDFLEGFNYYSGTQSVPQEKSPVASFSMAEKMGEYLGNAFKGSTAKKEGKDAFLEGFNFYSQQDVKPAGGKFSNGFSSIGEKAGKKTDDFLEGFTDPYGEKEEKSGWDKFLDGASMALTAASFVPVLDTFTNIAQIPVDLLRGDYTDAALDLAGVIPFVGEVADGAKTVRTADRIVDGVRAGDDFIDGVKVVDDAVDGIKAADDVHDAAKVVDGDELPRVKYPGDDPNIAPGKEFEWRGQYPPSEGKGAWYNPQTEESMHWDLNHEEPIGPHWDYIDSDGNTFRIYKDGRVELSKRGEKRNEQ